MTAPSTTLLGAGAGLAAALAWGLASLLFARALRPRGASSAARGMARETASAGGSRAGAGDEPPSAAAANLFKNALGLAVFGGLLAVDLPASPSARAWLFLLGSGFLGFALGDALYIAAVARVGVQRAAVLGLLNVPVAAVLAAAFLGERLHPVTLAWMTVVLAGVLLVMGRSRRSGAAPAGARGAVARGTSERGGGASGAGEPDAGARRGGLACALLAPVCWGSSIVLGHGGMAELGVLTGTVLRLAGGVGAALVLAALQGLATRRGARTELARLVAPLARPRLARSLLPAGVVGALLCLGFFHYALRELPGGVSPIFYSTTPLFTLPLGLLFGERHGRRVVLGTLVGFVGVVGLVRTLPPDGAQTESSSYPALPAEPGGLRFPDQSK